jgi:Flp pilus assembly protein TadD
MVNWPICLNFHLSYIFSCLHVVHILTFKRSFSSTTIADPECDVAIATLGQLFLQQGKIEKAIEYFEKSIDMARTEAELTSALGFREAANSQLVFARDYPEQSKALKR